MRFYAEAIVFQSLIVFLLRFVVRARLWVSFWLGM